MLRCAGSPVSLSLGLGRVSDPFRPSSPPRCYVVLPPSLKPARQPAEIHQLLLYDAPGTYGAEPQHLKQTDRILCRVANVDRREEVQLSVFHVPAPRTTDGLPTANPGSVLVWCVWQRSRRVLSHTRCCTAPSSVQRFQMEEIIWVNITSIIANG